MSNEPFPEWLHVAPEVAAALRGGQPVVALESTLIAHGLPWPVNLETAQAAEDAVRAEGAIPATIAVLDGRPTVGLEKRQLEFLAHGRDIAKASRRDLANAVLRGRSAATTVSATMQLAHASGIRLFATGGIGGVHRGAAQSFDISADLTELAATPVAVVCAGAKSILDIPATLEYLETLAVPTVGYGTDTFPAFYLQSSGKGVSARVDSPARRARLLLAHWRLQGLGVVLAQPLDAASALDPERFAGWLAQAEQEADEAGVHGPAVTPYLLKRLAEISEGETLRANQTLVIANARLAAQIARDLLAHPG